MCVIHVQKCTKILCKLFFSVGACLSSKGAYLLKVFTGQKPGQSMEAV